VRLPRECSKRMMSWITGERRARLRSRRTHRRRTVNNMERYKVYGRAGIALGKGSGPLEKAYKKVAAERGQKHEGEERFGG
jgi:hypothetical protein